MGKLYLTAAKDDSTVVVGKRPMVNRSPKKYITRKEAVAFLTYLREKEYVTIEERTEERGLFNRYVFDYRPLESEALDLIKSADTAEDAYGIIASKKAKLNCLWKTFPQGGAFFSEDLVEYLMSLGMDEEESKQLTICIENRAFSKSKWYKDKRLPDNFRLWAKASAGFLYSRNHITDLFRIDYSEFCRDILSQEDTFLTLERPWDDAYRFLVPDNLPDEVLILTYRGEANTVNKDDFVDAVKTLCKETGVGEVWIRNLNEDKITLVKRKQSRDRANDQGIF